jgi:cleavage and polyadenylation specificity factor subunit 5
VSVSTCNSARCSNLHQLRAQQVYHGVSLDHPTLDSYHSERESQPEEDTSVQARIHRLTKQYQETGVRRSIDAVLIVTVGPPHSPSPDLSSMGYRTSSSFKSPTLSTSCKSISTKDGTDGRPGGYLDPTETDAEGIVIRLDEQLGVPIEHSGEGNKYEPGGWKVRECLSAWWRPNFDTFLVSHSA